MPSLKAESTLAVRSDVLRATAVGDLGERLPLAVGCYAVGPLSTKAQVAGQALAVREPTVEVTRDMPPKSTPPP